MQKNALAVMVACAFSLVILAWANRYVLWVGMMKCLDPVDLVLRNL